MFSTAEKRKITDERQALEEALIRLEKDANLLRHGFLSGTSEPNLGDLAAYGALRGIQGLSAHTTIVSERGGLLHEWYEHTQKVIGY